MSVTNNREEWMIMKKFMQVVGMALLAAALFIVPVYADTGTTPIIVDGEVVGSIETVVIDSTLFIPLGTHTATRPPTSVEVTSPSRRAEFYSRGSADYSFNENSVQILNALGIQLRAEGSGFRVQRSGYGRIDFEVPRIVARVGQPIEHFDQTIDYTARTSESISRRNPRTRLWIYDYFRVPERQARLSNDHNFNRATEARRMIADYLRSAEGSEYTPEQIRAANGVMVRHQDVYHIERRTVTDRDFVFSPSAEPRIINGVVMVPLLYVAEHFRFDIVGWDTVENFVIINIK